MKNKKGLIITLICLIGIGISILLLSGHRPFKDLEAADITSANVRLSPPDNFIGAFDFTRAIEEARNTTEKQQKTA